MSYFNDVYKARVNRFGDTYQSRIQGEREALFEKFLLKSVYRVDFEYDGEMHSGSFEKYKQNETKTLHYLLTKTDLNIPGGTILMLENKDYEQEPWMVYYLERIKASGYNRYILIRMTHKIRWTDRQGKKQWTYAYMYGQEDNMLKDEIRSRSKKMSVYAENMKLSFFIIPTNPNLKKDDYFEIGEGPLQESYRVTGYDIQSTEGVEFVSVDPIYKYDLTPAPEQTPQDDSADFFWLNGGHTNGS